MREKGKQTDSALVYNFLPPNKGKQLTEWKSKNSEVYLALSSLILWPKSGKVRKHLSKLLKGEQVWAIC